MRPTYRSDWMWKIHLLAVLGPLLVWGTLLALAYGTDWRGWHLYAAIGAAFAVFHFHSVEKMYFIEGLAVRHGPGWMDAAIDPSAPGRYEIANGWAWNPRVSYADFSAIGFWVRDFEVARALDDGHPVPLIAVRRWRRK